MFTCQIRYTLDPAKLEDFRAYARTWIELIRENGGTHHGYFLPPEPGVELPKEGFSYPELGRAGPPDVATCLFTFPSLAAYEAYRAKVARDPRCVAITARVKATRCFTNYERTFLSPIF